MRADDEVRRALDRAEVVPLRPEARREAVEGGPERSGAARLRVVAGTEGPAPHFPGEEEEPAAAVAKLRTAVTSFLDQAAAWDPEKGTAPQKGVKSAAGLGKTTAVLDALAARPGPRREVWYLVPTARLGEELAAKARERGLAVEVVRGREAAVGGAPLCRKHEESRLVARAGLHVMETLCRRKAPNGTEMVCEFHGSCRYLEQFRNPRPVLRIFAHEYLFVGLPRSLPDPALVVVDEAFALHAARHASLGLDRLTSQRVGMRPEHEAEIHDVAVRVRDLLERGLDPRDAADAGTFARVAQLEAAVADEAYVWPSMRWEEQKRRLAGLQRSERFKLAALWRVLRDAAGRGGPAPAVELRRDEPTADGELQDRLHVWWRAPLRVPEAPVLLLDASLDERLARKLFPRIAGRDDRRPTQRRGRPGRRHPPCSRNRLLSFEGRRTAEQARAANRLADVRRLAEVEAAGRGVLLVTYKAAEERLGAIPGVDVAHFGRAARARPLQGPRHDRRRRPRAAAPGRGRGPRPLAVRRRRGAAGPPRRLHDRDPRLPAARRHPARRRGRRPPRPALPGDPRAGPRARDRAGGRPAAAGPPRAAGAGARAQQRAARPHRRPAGDVAGGGAGPAGGRRRPARRGAAARPGLAGGAVPRPMGDPQGRGDRSRPPAFKPSNP
jgi:hypothetical protein